MANIAKKLLRTVEELEKKYQDCSVGERVGSFWDKAANLEFQLRKNKEKLNLMRTGFKKEIESMKAVLDEQKGKR